MLLRLDEAKRIAEGAIEKAGEFDIKISVAVCEAGGKLLVFKRMDGIAWAGVYGSKRKALASAAFNLSVVESRERKVITTRRSRATKVGT